MTRDLDQADRILDRDQQARVLNRADAQMARDVPVIPLFQGLLAVYVRSNVRNFVHELPWRLLESGELVARALA